MFLFNKEVYQKLYCLAKSTTTGKPSEHTYFCILLLIPIFILQGLEEMKTV